MSGVDGFYYSGTAIVGGMGLGGCVYSSTGTYHNWSFIYIVDVARFRMLKIAFLVVASPCDRSHALSRLRCKGG